MTHTQLALNRYILEEVKEGRMPSITDNEKIDCDYMAGYYDNLILDIEKEKTRNKKAIWQNFILTIEVNK